MSLLDQPGITPRDLIRVQPVAWQEGADPDIDLGSWVASAPTIRVYSKKLGSGQSYRDGKQDQTVSYVLYADHRRGRPFPVGEKDRIWHPEASDTHPDGTPDYGTALDVDSVVTYDKDGVGEIQCGRTY